MRPPWAAAGADATQLLLLNSFIHWASSEYSRWVPPVLGAGDTDSQEEKPLATHSRSRTTSNAKVGDQNKDYSCPGAAEARLEEADWDSVPASSDWKIVW